MTENTTQRTLSTRLQADRESSQKRMKNERSGGDMARKWRRRFAMSFAALIAVSAIATAAITSSTSSFSGLKGDVYKHDESTLAIVSKGMDLQATALSAAGDAQAGAIEMAASFGAANTAIAEADWFYSVDVKEAAVDSLASGTIKVELFQDGTSKGALYITQGTAVATAVEGVTLKWSLGSSLTANAAYVVKATSV